MITGILGQLIGLYSAFRAIEQAGDISPALVFGGIKVSMITTFYGIFIYLLSLLLWFVVSLVLDRIRNK
jgi:biopolymer transport protein ExbB/TolQ